MEKNRNELISELNELKSKYSELEAKYKEEIDSLKSKEKEYLLRIMFLEGVANSAIDGFLVVDPYGQKILQNQRTVELWKIPEDIVNEPSGKKQVEHVMYMTVNPQQFIDEINYLREHPDDKSRDEIELIDGTTLDRYSSAVIGIDGKNYGRIWTFHDVTERKKFEKQLVELNKDKDHFISILAHDLRSPFNSLLGFSILLKENIQVYSIDKIEEMVGILHGTIHRTYELLEDTLLWASIQSKKIIFKPSNADVFEVLKEVLEIVAPSAKSKNITIKNNLSNELEIFVDVYMLKAILRNIISNALKFTHKGGEIEISILHSDSETIFSIIDNGVGIDSEILAKIFSFDAFQSTEGTANEKGTGLGLMLCKEFVDQHSGKIWINSKVNKGTKVFFTIPSKKIN